MSIPEFRSDLEILLHHTSLGVPSIVTGYDLHFSHLNEQSSQMYTQIHMIIVEDQLMG
jgi:hypothetical protein